MTQHKDIQDPHAYQDQDYEGFEQKLFAPETSDEELEEICMTLAHLPTKRAQILLSRFSESERSEEVRWLDCAIEEGQFHYLSPQNDQEERDYLTLDVIRELEDRIVRLQEKYEEQEISLKKARIRHEAVLELIQQGELDEEEGIGFENFQMCEENDLEEMAKEIAVKEKTVAQLKKSIKTPKYQDIDLRQIGRIHFES